MSSTHDKRSQPGFYNGPTFLLLYSSTSPHRILYSSLAIAYLSIILLTVDLRAQFNDVLKINISEYLFRHSLCTTGYLTNHAGIIAGVVFQGAEDEAANPVRLFTKQPRQMSSHA